jgi:hypothetical protein
LVDVITLTNSGIGVLDGEVVVANLGTAGKVVALDHMELAVED